jgi:predicted glycogen debranching enzyme
MLDPRKQNAEWLEADGLGGFASGTASGVRTRRYHALLLTAATPPCGRMALVNGFDAWLDLPGGSVALSSQRYAPDVIHPDGAGRIESFEHEPWPRWRYRVAGDLAVEHELFVVHGKSAVVLTWKLAGVAGENATVRIRPFLSGRDFHATHHENEAFRFDAEQDGERVVWRPYAGVPGVIARGNGRYAHEPLWFHNFLYTEELARGLDAAEDLASPGEFAFDISKKPAVLVFIAEGHTVNRVETVEDLYVHFVNAERCRRENFATPLDRAADAYLVPRGGGRTIVAGYPWFGDWGRDAFIALRGLCLATGRIEDARDILVEWSGVVSEGTLPNRFPDRGEQPEYNSVDASLWYAVAVHDYLRAAESRRPASFFNDAHREKLRAAVDAILTGYSRGTRFGIRADSDGLLAAGAPGVQLTWMDAKVGDWVVTPRIGKPVEVQALWLNALAIAAEFSERWREPFERGRAAFREKFWNEARGCLFDVIDCDHKPGANDASFRPNQIFAVGGLPLALLDGDRARRVVEAVEQKLLTPLGLRSLAPGEPGYAPRYEGGVLERDGAYHQGTVWPWLLGPFVEAWLRVRENTDDAKREARERFLAPLIAHLDEAGLGHVSEIADAEPPHTPRGCPFQAWSLGELLRLDRVVLGSSL